MEFLELLGSYSTEIILGLVGVVLVLLVLYIINIVQMSKLKKRYRIFMEGNTAKNLENTLIKRLDQVDALIEANNANEKDIRTLFANMKFAFQKAGLVKYDAFNELGGKLSFSLALLNETNDGYMFNTVHSREGCYIYMKEIIKGNSIIMLTDEEKQALDIAMGNVKKSSEE
ncbi:MAG: DUF4446 family protein [Lachnospiraceae bacterium]|nr:DUF4446 family protein [Lachnospiraceae bacterium]MBQ9580421.1 DUF4446 family protein [Lachnospiraceae bacterium]